MDNQITIFDMDKDSLTYTYLDLLDIRNNKLENLDGIVDLKKLNTLYIGGNENLDLNQLKEAKFNKNLVELDYDQHIDQDVLDEFVALGGY
jgi:Leucine-rich repeat (LRR) protein